MAAGDTSAPSLPQARPLRQPLLGGMNAREHALENAKFTRMNFEAEFV